VVRPSIFAILNQQPIHFRKGSPKNRKIASLAPVCFLINAQPRNLLQNPDAGHGTQGWRTYGQATIENSVDGNPWFVVRNGGYLIQDVNGSL